MPLIKNIKIKDGQLLLWKMNEDIDILHQAIPEAVENPAFSQIKSVKRKKEWLTVRLLLKEIGCSTHQITYLKNGQPTINHSSYKYISISHSDKLAGIFLHKFEPVGLDIENVNRDFSKVEKKFLAGQEIDLAGKISNGHCLFWTIKEAAYKIAGVEGIHFTEQLKIEENDSKSFQVRILTNPPMNFNINHFVIDDQLVLYLVNEKGNNV